MPKIDVFYMLSSGKCVYLHSTEFVPTKEQAIESYVNLYEQRPYYKTIDEAKVGETINVSNLVARINK
jgi:hypothetical protein